jgi:hypothetical protein
VSPLGGKRGLELVECHVEVACRGIWGACQLGQRGSGGWEKGVGPIGLGQSQRLSPIRLLVLPAASLVVSMVANTRGWVW